MKSTATSSTNQKAAVTGPDCERVTTILDQIIVGQAPSEEDEDYFVHHAEDCSPCFDSIDKQRVFIGFLTQYVGRKGAPNALEGIIMKRVHVEMA